MSKNKTNLNENHGTTSKPLPPPFQRRSIGELMDQPGNRPVIFKLIAYTLIMFLTPILVYFVVNQHIDKFVEVAPEKAYLYGAIASIVTVNLIILAYVVSAIREPADDDHHQD